MAKGAVLVNLNTKNQINATPSQTSTSTSEHIAHTNDNDNTITITTRHITTHHTVTWNTNATPSDPVHHDTSTPQGTTTSSAIISYITTTTTHTPFQQTNTLRATYRNLERQAVQTHVPT
ncbi:hypothetical protein GQ43DRAFT_472972 [Delitschia confertaspora ATCC 74209]|uniref:Uncharacterized protein n=1 Tax=Delitschia confertaspora ATCC 74209 TaxID=1513339 RepID=A0A9P4JIP3_9PLEO|nr:hypothetical protein GQ43DRAFT_472972 [Delitschia confertaspora ATCC 74209]